MLAWCRLAAASASRWNGRSCSARLGAAAGVIRSILRVMRRLSRSSPGLVDQLPMSLRSAAEDFCLMARYLAEACIAL